MNVLAAELPQLSKNRVTVSAVVTVLPSYSQIQMMYFNWHMHGLISETSISLLAGSTRLDSSFPQSEQFSPSVSTFRPASRNSPS